MSCRILQGDWIEVLRTLPDESVHCVVTSPPYWGLRDYGTATWEGGDAECDHSHFLGGNGSSSAKQVTSAGTQKYQFRDECGKCGAIRIDAQLGLERTPDEYVAKMVEGFREVRRVLRSDGTCWVNLGDSYNASPGQRTVHDKAGTKQQTVRGSCEAASRNTQDLKPKDLCGIPWRVAFALQSDGWWLRQDIIWAKPNPMPESVTDRCTKSHEYIFLLTKSAKYFYDAEAINEEGTSNRPDMAKNGIRTGLAYLQQGPVASNSVKGRTGRNAFRGQGANRDSETGPANRDGREMRDIGAGATRNKRSVWNITTKPYSEAHFATFPPEIPETCIKAGTSERGCCPECGSPWERVTEKVPNGGKQKMPSGMATYEGSHDSIHRDGRELIPTYTETTETRTTGWRPTCTCNAGDPVPCTVMDIFNGAGTSGLVATRLSRNYIGIDLNTAYNQMATDRIVGDAPLFNSVEGATQ